MRLKRLLGVLIALLIAGSMWAAAPQLTNISVAAVGKTTTLTLHATGGYTHNEYRPADNLLLVDLTGISAGNLQDKTKELNVPGVKSYHVVAYKGAGGVEVTRVEMTLVGGSEVQVTEGTSGLSLTITAPASQVEPGSQTAQAPANEPTATTTARSNGSPARVERVRAFPEQGDVRIEVSVQGTVSPEVMTLTTPDRLVIDFPNTILRANQHPLAVNSGDVKSVRLSRFQIDPPVTRIVLDLKAPAEYGVEQAGPTLVFKVRPSSGTQVNSATDPKPAFETAAPVEAAPAESAKAAPAPALQNAALQTEAKSAPTQNLTPLIGQEGKGDSDKGSAVAFVEPTYTPKVDQRSAEAAQVVAQNQVPPVPQANQSTQPGGQPPAQQPAVNFAREQRAQGTEQLTKRPRYTGEPISVNLKDVDIKDFFRLIHEISGLNVVLDPAISGTLTLVLDDVPWDQALDIVLRNNGLDHQLDGNVLRVAKVETLRSEAEAKAAEQRAQALAIDKVSVARFLSYAHAKDVVPTIKKMLSARGDVIADDRTNAIIIQDIPSVIPTIDAMIRQLDRKTQEVEIEARVVAATRSFARDIGMQLGFGTGSSVFTVGGATAVGTSPIIANNPTSPQYIVNSGSIPLFSNLALPSPTSGISFSNATNAYRIDAVLQLAESRGLLKVLSRPRVVTQNNIKAEIEQGVRLPVVTQAQLGGPPTVSYVDAMLKLTVSPQITVENTIFLNVDVENTTPDFSNEVQGNPALDTQQATTQVLVTDGGTVIIGGIVQSTNSVNILQVPLLGSLPGIGNLFKSRSVSTQTQELIFFITPKIVET